MNQMPDHSAGTGSAYRAYLIGDTGKVASKVDVLALTDDEAIRQTATIDHNGAVELWDRGRVIFRHAKGEHDPLVRR